MAVVIAIGAPALSSAQSLANEAVEYRVKGYELQRQGEASAAMANYQKAVAIDPTYAAPHNDLGVLFEVQGEMNRAEAEYQAAIKADPNYLEAYTNLALLYEKLGQKERAIYYWLKRASMGHPLDAWTIRAKERLVAVGVFEKKEDIEWSVQEAQQDAILLIAQEYARAKELFANASYFEAILVFQKVVRLEQEYRPIYTPYALEYIRRSQVAIAELERQGLNPSLELPAMGRTATPGASVSATPEAPLSMRDRVLRRQLDEMEHALSRYERTTDKQGDWNKRPFP
ncbi:MAG: tetratricopeptide repeat protein [Candidatus Omnitrophica bacterium]|nr:tetratricopeptide repeat protein [Candidatus Omnitrophota bacterium]